MADTDVDSSRPSEPGPIVSPSLAASDGPSTRRTGWTGRAVGTRHETHPERSEHCLRTMVVAIHAAVHTGSIPGGPDGQQGQSTVEYALILLGAAAIALALVSWVTGSNVVGRLFDTVIDRILGRV